MGNYTGRRSLLAVVGVVAVTLVALVALGQGGHRASAAPAPVRASEPHLVIVPAALPLAGGEVALIAANPSPSPRTYGISGTVDRWNGHVWKSFRTFDSGLASSGYVGSLRSSNDGSAMSIGLDAAAHGYGPVQWVRVGSLGPGQYRFRNEAGAGVLTISAAAAPAPSARPGGAAVLQGPDVVAASTAGTTTWAPAIVNDQGLNHVRRDLGRLTGPVHLTRLVGRTWLDEATVPLAKLPAAPASPPLAFALHLPSLPAGPNHLDVATSRGPHLQAVFWALPPL